MDEERKVADFSSDRGEIIDRDNFPLSLYDTFRKAEPYYLAIGMSDHDFWHGKNDLKIAYREADKIRRKRKNEELWLQGKYMYDAYGALLQAFGKSGKAEKYIEKPYNIMPKTRAEKDAEEKAVAEKAKAKLLAWMKQNKGGEG